MWSSAARGPIIVNTMGRCASDGWRCLACCHSGFVVRRHIDYQCGPCGVWYSTDPCTLRVVPAALVELTPDAVVMRCVLLVTRSL
ncbi:hypothetical protein C8Q80DRAFT_1136671 [Daedaleopsis nitida]|nr:hypothetical protein C8Q80DRAFT_1136671 [Daedaleopsis nitida]